MPGDSRKTGSEPKRHHVAAASYLAGFTHEVNKKEGRLWITDSKELWQRESCPANAARHSHFYTANFGAGVDPRGVEKAFAHLEGKWATVLGDILQKSRLPTQGTEALADLIGFVAFQAMRTPSARDDIQELFDQQSKDELIARLSDGNDWEGFVEHMRSIGEPVKVTRDELRESAMQRNYDISIDKRSAIQIQLRSAILLYLHLSQREWSLFEPNETAPDFVCSDSPVSITSASDRSSRELGFCQRRSVVTMPLGRRHALVGAYEGRLDMELPAGEVAGLNTMTIRDCRQIYSADPEFSYLCDEGKTGSQNDFLLPS